MADRYSQPSLAAALDGGAAQASLLGRTPLRDVTFVLTSDAHHARELERVRFAARNAERAWIPPERIANAWPAERLAAWAERKVKRAG